MVNSLPHPEPPELENLRKKSVAPDAASEHRSAAGEIHHSDGRIEHPSVHSEPHRLAVFQIMAVILAITFAGAAILYLVWIFFHATARQQQTAKASNYPLSRSPMFPLPSGPRLEPLDRLIGTETRNVDAQSLANEQWLKSYGPTDERGFVHIPIQQAMKLIVRKLPVRSQPALRESHKDEGLLDAGEPNSGRVFAEPNQ
jgi:hypothetical protein